MVSITSTMFLIGPHWLGCLLSAPLLSLKAEPLCFRKLSLLFTKLSLLFTKLSLWSLRSNIHSFWFVNDIVCIQGFIGMECVKCMQIYILLGDVCELSYVTWWRSLNWVPHGSGIHDVHTCITQHVKDQCQNTSRYMYTSVLKETHLSFWTVYMIVLGCYLLLP